MNSQEQPQYQGISTRITNASQPQPYSSSHAASQEQQVSSFTNYDRSPQSGQISHNQGVLGSQLSSVGKVTSGTTSTANSCQISVNQGSFTQVSSYHDNIVGNSSSCHEGVHNLVDFSGACFATVLPFNQTPSNVDLSAVASSTLSRTSMLTTSSARNQKPQRQPQVSNQQQQVSTPQMGMGDQNPSASNHPHLHHKQNQQNSNRGAVTSSFSLVIPTQQQQQQHQQGMVHHRSPTSPLILIPTATAATSISTTTPTTNIGFSSLSLGHVTRGGGGTNIGTTIANNSSSSSSSTGMIVSAGGTTTNTTTTTHQQQSQQHSNDNTSPSILSSLHSGGTNQQQQSSQQLSQQPHQQGITPSSPSSSLFTSSQQLSSLSVPHCVIFSLDQNNNFSNNDNNQNNNSSSSASTALPTIHTPLTGISSSASSNLSTTTTVATHHHLPHRTILNSTVSSSSAAAIIGTAAGIQGASNSGPLSQSTMNHSQHHHHQQQQQLQQHPQSQHQYAPSMMMLMMGTGHHPQSAGLLPFDMSSMVGTDATATSSGTIASASNSMSGTQSTSTAPAMIAAAALSPGTGSMSAQLNNMGIDDMIMSTAGQSSSERFRQQQFEKLDIALQNQFPAMAPNQRDSLFPLVDFTDQIDYLDVLNIGDADSHVQPDQQSAEFPFDHHFAFNDDNNQDITDHALLLDGVRIVHDDPMMDSAAQFALPLDVMFSQSTHHQSYPEGLFQVESSSMSSDAQSMQQPRDYQQPSSVTIAANPPSGVMTHHDPNIALSPSQHYDPMVNTIDGSALFSSGGGGSGSNVSSPVNSTTGVISSSYQSSNNQFASSSSSTTTSTTTSTMTRASSSSSGKRASPTRHVHSTKQERTSKRKRPPPVPKGELEFVNHGQEEIQNMIDRYHKKMDEKEVRSGCVPHNSSTEEDFGPRHLEVQKKKSRNSKPYDEYLTTFHLVVDQNSSNNNESK